MRFTWCYQIKNGQGRREQPPAREKSGKKQKGTDVSRKSKSEDGRYRQEEVANKGRREADWLVVGAS